MGNRKSRPAPPEPPPLRLRTNQGWTFEARPLATGRQLRRQVNRHGDRPARRVTFSGVAVGPDDTLAEPTRCSACTDGPSTRPSCTIPGP